MALPAVLPVLADVAYTAAKELAVHELKQQALTQAFPAASKGFEAAVEKITGKRLVGVNEVRARRMLAAGIFLANNAVTLVTFIANRRKRRVPDIDNGANDEKYAVEHNQKITRAGDANKREKLLHMEDFNRRWPKAFAAHRLERTVPAPPGYKITFIMAIDKWNDEGSGELGRFEILDNGRAAFIEINGELFHGVNWGVYVYGERTN